VLGGYAGSRGDIHVAESDRLQLGFWSAEAPVHGHLEAHRLQRRDRRLSALLTGTFSVETLLFSLQTLVGLLVAVG
jgi:hypothetical protein